MTASKSFRGIIQRMVQTIRSYRLVRWVDKTIKQEDKAHPEVAGQGKKHRLYSGLIVKKYAVLRHKSESEIRDLVEYCVKKEYLALETDKKGLKYQYVDNGDGRDLLEGWWFFPWWGLLREIWSRNSSLITMIIGLVGGFIIGKL